MKQTRNIKRPLSAQRIGEILSYLKDGKDKIAVLVGTVTFDTRQLDLPKMRVAALQFTETARKNIMKAGGECLTFDQLALLSPDGKGTVLLRGGRRTEVTKRFGNPGSSGSHAKPKVRHVGRNFEKARGRRSSRGYKVKA